MKRTVLALVAVGALVASTHAADAAVKKKPAPPKPKPVTKTFYFHGTNNFGNQDQMVDGGLMTMNATKPTGATNKQFGLVAYGAGPNTACAGNSLFPNWVGDASGQLTGIVKVSFWAQSTPAKVNVQVFADTNAQACNEAYPGAIGEVAVDLPAKAAVELVTVSIPVKTTKLSSSFTIQFAPVDGLPIGPQLSNIAYDSAAAPSSVTWTCLPKTGKKTC